MVSSLQAGSASVGKVFGQLESKHLKPVLMKLGGKAPAGVLQDANLKQAVKVCAMGAFPNHGQIRMSTDRIIDVKEVVDEFAEYFKDEFKAYHAPEVGPAQTVSIAETAKSLVDNAVRMAYPL